MKYSVLRECIVFSALNLLSITALISQEIDFSSGNTYNSCEITAENILSLVPATPESLISEVHNFCDKDPRILPMLSGTDWYEKDRNFNRAPLTVTSREDAIYTSFWGSRREYSKTLGNKSNYNFVLPLNSEWLIKASGGGNRRENINSYFGHEYGTALSQEQIERFILECGKTYQTVSRMAYWLRSKEIKNKLNLNRVGVPKKYLVRLPNRSAHIDDTNYVVVAKNIAGAVPITQTDLPRDPEVIKQLTQWIGYSAAWSVNPENILAHENKAWVVDLEQPNVHKPTDFFHKNIEIHRSNVLHGWNELETNIIVPYGETHAVDMSQILEEKKRIQEQIQQTWTN